MITNNVQTKAVVTVAEMARMCGLSRARFYQLQNAGVFPTPLYDVSTRRPFYVEEAQKICLEVRRRNCGINGQPVLFYAKRGGSPSASEQRKKRVAKPKPTKQYTAIVDAVRSLGLKSTTDDQVAVAVKSLFPNGIEQIQQSEVVRAVFIELQRQNSSK